jgi:hypothetical protein
MDADRIAYIAGLVVGAGIVIAAYVCLIVYIVRKRKGRKPPSN